MADYTKLTNFTSKDALVSGDPLKVVRGTEIDVEFDAIATSVATKADKAGPTFTGTLTAAAITASGAVTVVDGNFNVTGSSDATKKVKLEVDGLTTGTTRVITPPDRDITLNSLSPIAASLGADVVLNNTANYFDGPSIAQGTSGTWFVSGTVVCTDTAGTANHLAKLWDGTTVIASAITQSVGASGVVSMSLSGFLASPAGNLRISVRDLTSTNGLIKFNATGLSKDSTISAIRVA